MREIRISDRSSGQRLDKFLQRYLPGATVGFLYKMLRKKNILLNGKRAAGREMLSEGDLLTLYFSEDTIAHFQDRTKAQQQGTDKDPTFHAYPSLDPSMIVYEDERLLLVNKPAGMLSQKAQRDDRSLPEYVIGYLREHRGLNEQDRLFYTPGPANRLDRNTSGLVAVPLTLHAAQELAALIRDHRMSKEYLALAHGHCSGEMYFHDRMIRANGVSHILSDKDIAGRSHEGVDKSRELRMRCRPLCHVPSCEKTEEEGGLSLLLVTLLTGRTHQIRSQLAYHGMPLVGDPKYGGSYISFDKRMGMKRQFLHSFRLCFPETQGLFSDLSGRCFTAPLPSDAMRFLERAGIRPPVDPDR